MDQDSVEFPSRGVFPNLIERGPSFIRRNINAPIDNFLSFFRNRTNGSSFSSGSFEFIPQYDTTGSGPPSMFNKPFSFYHETLCDFCYALPHAPRWSVFIEPHNSEFLQEEIMKTKMREPTRSSEDWSFPDATEYLLRDEAQQTIGCIFALGVSEAGGSIGVSNVGGMNEAIQGFSKAPITQGKAEENPLEITFKETNCSYSDFFLRPWMMLAGHKGLFARSRDKSIKADITIFELAPTFERQAPIVRKIFRYHDCVPINIPLENLNYEADRVIQKQVQFAYNFYTVQDGTGFGASNIIESQREQNLNQGFVGNDVFGVFPEK